VTAAAKSPALDVAGVWSHFVYADAPGHPTIARQVERFAEAVDVAKRAGLPIDRFVAATNVNDVVPEYLTTGRFEPRASQQTVANAMDRLDR
jgi:alanine racemase